ncbi:MAG: hypothetical protein AAF391_04705 [Bacteroidota bacterium]
MKQVNWADHIFNFLAVIIGVSLAFFVNDNAARTRESTELNVVIKSFLDELKDDSTVFADYQIPDNEEQSLAIQQVIGMLKSGVEDSLEIKFQKAININGYHPSCVTFNSLASSGKLDLIKDFELRKELAEYHTVYAQEAKWRGEFQVDYYSENLLPWLIKNVDFTDDDTSALNDRELINLLLIYDGLISNKVRQYKLLTREAGKLRAKLKALQ